METLIQFKEPRHRDEWCSGLLSPVLAQIVLEVAQSDITRRLKTDTTITCIWRSLEEDKALGGHLIHPAWRAVDFRVPSGLWSDPWGCAIADWLNARWKYDKGASHPVALFEPHGNAPHLHIQSHPETARR